MMSQSQKYLAGFLVLVLAVAGAGLLGRYMSGDPVVEEKIIYQDRVIYRDQIVYRDRDIVRTELRPDGTRIEEKTVERLVAVEKSTEESKSKEVIKLEHFRPTWSLSLSLGSELILQKPSPLYQIGLGYSLTKHVDLNSSLVLDTIGRPKYIFMGATIKLP